MPAEERLVRYTDLSPGRLYTFIGVDPKDSLVLRVGDQWSKLSWKQVGELTVGDKIIVLESKVKTFNSVGTRLFIDVLWKNGKCWICIDPKMCPDGTKESIAFRLDC